MIVDVIAFISGLAIGGIPSVLTYVAIKREVYADWVIGNLEKKKIIDGGVLTSHYALAHPAKPVSLLDLANAMIKHAQLNPKEWEVIEEANAVKVQGRKMFGVRNKTTEMSCLRNHLTFSKSEDIWLNDVKIKESIFNHVLKGVREAVNNEKMQRMLTKLHTQKVLPSPNDSPFSDELGNQLLSDFTKQTENKLKEDGGKTIDPFAPTWNDHIYQIGKARASMDALLQKSKTIRKRKK